jgi:hypothetical protein
VRYSCGELIFAEPLRPSGTLRKDEVPHVRVAVVDQDTHFARKDEAAADEQCLQCVDQDLPLDVAGFSLDDERHVSIVLVPVMVVADSRLPVAGIVQAIAVSFDAGARQWS